MKSHTLSIKMKIMLAFSKHGLSGGKESFTIIWFLSCFHFPNQGNVNDVLFPH